MGVVHDVLWINRFPLECTSLMGQVDSPVICDRWHVIGVTALMANVPGCGRRDARCRCQEGVLVLTDIL